VQSVPIITNVVSSWRGVQHYVIKFVSDLRHELNIVLQPLRFFIYLKHVYGS
jgi:hypothetical protein